MLLNARRAREVMAERELDALISSSTQNNTYFSDVPVTGFVIFPSSGDAIVVAGVLDSLVLAETPSWIKDLRFYGLFHIVPARKRRLSKTEKRVNDLVLAGTLQKGHDPLQILVESIQERGLGRKRLGIDGSGISPAQFETLMRRLRSAELIDATQDIEWIRAVKTREEIQNLEKAAKMTEQGFLAVEDVAKEGVSEKELSVAFRKAIAEEEEFGIRWYNFPCGTRGAVALVPPSRYKLKRGDLIQLHASVSHRSYNSDIARGAVIGRPSEKQLKVWKAIVKGEEKIMDRVEPGVRASELFDVGVGTVRRAGLPDYERWHTGHGIGLGPNYDPPSLAPKDERKIEEGMVLCIETPYYEIGFGGMNLEDTGVVTERGFRLFTSHRTDLKTI